MLVSFLPKCGFSCSVRSSKDYTLKTSIDEKMVSFKIDQVTIIVCFSYNYSIAGHLQCITEISDGFTG